MQIVFVSNYLNHHQLPFCQSILEQNSGNFVFVACEKTPQERLNMGYYDMNEQYPFVLRAYESEEKKAEAFRVAIECDVLIVGGMSSLYLDRFVNPRMKLNKLTFQYLERIYKRGVWRVLSPRGALCMYRYHARYRNKKLYVLCASAYTAWDLSLTGSCINKTYKWGYFPKVQTYPIDQLMIRKKNNPKPSILWCARLIELKHPEAAILLAEQLKREGYKFELNLIGNGILEQSLRKMLDEKGLNDYVHLLGAMSPEEVREHMEQANIFLFTSDYNEGWGAVLNESMNSACAVVASHAIGSVPFLIDHGKNGFVYENGNQISLHTIVKRLLDEPLLCETVGRNAYETMINEWAPEAAAERFLHLSEFLLDKKQKNRHLYDVGPCSEAKRISNSKMKHLARRLSRKK